MAVAIAVVYWDVLRSLGLAWYTDDNYSHGFFIAPLAAYFAWERRAEFTAKPIKPSAFGLVVVAGSLRPAGRRAFSARSCSFHVSPFSVC